MNNNSINLEEEEILEPSEYNDNQLKLNTLEDIEENEESSGSSKEARSVNDFREIEMIESPNLIA
jgi:hypothetical protein